MHPVLNCILFSAFCVLVLYCLSTLINYIRDKMEQRQRLRNLDLMIPLVTYKITSEDQQGSESEIEPQGDCCSICLEQFQENQPIKKMKNCGHLFHQDCIATWVLQQGTCPYCRLNLFEGEQQRNKNKRGSENSQASTVPYTPDFSINMLVINRP